MKFVDWQWIPYWLECVESEHVGKQRTLLIETGLRCVDLAYRFVPTKKIESLEVKLHEMYDGATGEAGSGVCMESFSSSCIEGAQLTFERAKELWNGASIDTNNEFSERMVLGGFNAFRLLEGVSGQLSLDDVLGAWNVLVEGACSNESVRGDRFRSGMVYVGNHAGLEPEKIEDAMVQWIDFFNGSVLSDYPFIKAAVLHFSFEFVHPFCDGNGRMGRLLSWKFLENSGFERISAFPFSQSVLASRSNYYSALKWSESDEVDCTPFIDFMLGCFVKTFSSVGK